MRNIIVNRDTCAILDEKTSKHLSARLLLLSQLGCRVAEIEVELCDTPFFKAGKYTVVNNDSVCFRNYIDVDENTRCLIEEIPDTFEDAVISGRILKTEEGLYHYPLVALEPSIVKNMCALKEKTLNNPEIKKFSKDYYIYADRDYSNRKTVTFVLENGRFSIIINAPEQDSGKRSVFIDAL